MRRGTVQPDGSSIALDGGEMLPEGVEDLAALGNDSQIDQALDEELQKLIGAETITDENRAKFKLEVVFAEARSRQAPYTGIVFAWTNGGFAHGGGDEVVYFCPAKVAKGDQVKTCNAPLDLKLVNAQAAVCPECYNASKPVDLTGQVMAKLTSQNWAKLLVRMFLLLGANADIRMGMMPGDLRTAATIEQERQRKGSVLNKVRGQRHWVRYPLSDIIKDTSNGSSLYKRIRVFLEA